MFSVALIHMADSTNWAAPSSDPVNRSDFCFGTGLLTVGGILLVASLILIMTGQIVRIQSTLIIIPSLQRARPYRPPHPTPFQIAADSVRQDRWETRLATSGPISTDDTASTLSGGFLALKVGQRLPSLAKEQGYAVRSEDTCVLFTKDGRVELLRDHLAE
jgi:hypothetical protein